MVQLSYPYSTTEKTLAQAVLTVKINFKDKNCLLGILIITLKLCRDVLPLIHLSPVITLVGEWGDGQGGSSQGVIQPRLLSFHKSPERVPSPRPDLMALTKFMRLWRPF